MKGHRADVFQTIFSPNSDYIASCGKDKTVILWDINSTRNYYELKGHKDFVRSIDFSADGTKLVSTSMKTVITWDTSFSKGLVLFKTVFDECDSLVVRFANDDKHIYVISSDKSLFILDGVNGETISRPISVFSASAKLNKISISTNDKHIACSTEDNQIVLYDSNDFVPLIKTMKKQTDLITCLSLSKKGNFMASGSQDNTLLIWDISNKDLRTVGPLKGHTKTLTALAFTDDEKKIASAGKDYIIIIWDTISGDILLDSLKKHSDTINVLEFSRDSEKLASGSKDGNIIIWNLINGEMLNRLKGFGASIKSLLFSKFNGVFLSGDSKG